MSAKLLDNWRVVAGFFGPVGLVLLVLLFGVMNSSDIHVVGVSIPATSSNAQTIGILLGWRRYRVQ